METIIITVVMLKLPSKRLRAAAFAVVVPLVVLPLVSACSSGGGDKPGATTTVEAIVWVQSASRTVSPTTSPSRAGPAHGWVPGAGNGAAAGPRELIV